MKRLKYDPSLFPHWKELEIRFRDLDPLNHVNNAVFNTYFEEARIAFANTVPEFVEGWESGKSFVLVKITINYTGQINFPMKIIIGTGLKEVKNSSILASQAIFDKESGKMLAFAESTGVWFDLKSQRPTRIPEIVDLENYLAQLNNG